MGQIDQIMDSVHRLGRCEENKTRYVIVKLTQGHIWTQPAALSKNNVDS